MKQTKLGKAIAYAAAGVALTACSIPMASAAVTTMYNLTTNYANDNSDNTSDPTAGGAWQLSGGTDGWNYGMSGRTVPIWAGTASSDSTPFGYVAPQLNWAVEITEGLGGKGEISTFDAFNRYGVYADIDTAKGAWSDAISGTTNPGAKGWRHDLEYGLFKSDTSGKVTLGAKGVLQSGTDFGFTVFKGMSTNTVYNHHGSWNALNNEFGLSPASFPFDPNEDNPWTISDIVAYSAGGANPINLNTISFDAVAGQIYTIVLGGYRNGAWGETNDGYRLTVSQVPVPGAAWLFGSALAGLVGVKRRKQTTV
ncbi:MAG: VPLPA-CTERM sorting domain-containing protein [Gammaproteobacteria bacterium]